MNTLLKASLPIAIALSLAACNGSSNDDNVARMTLESTNLEALGDDFEYEGWIIVDGAPVSTGKFDIVDGETVPAVFNLDVTQANAAATFVLTIEPAVENAEEAAAPAATKILAGPIARDASNNIVSSIVTDHPAAFNSDFSDAAGTFILATPSNGNTTPTQGIWYLVPPVAPAGPTPSLTLPTLPDGWMYEGWVVSDTGPISTGTFMTPDQADSDGAGPTAGPDGTPPLPGQDFINPPLDLVGLTSVISVEPYPDNSPAPFVMKPLIKANIAATGNVLSNEAASSLPSGTVTIQF